MKATVLKHREQQWTKSEITLRRHRKQKQRQKTNDTLAAEATKRQLVAA